MELEAFSRITREFCCTPGPNPIIRDGKKSLHIPGRSELGKSTVATCRPRSVLTDGEISIPSQGKKQGALAGLFLRGRQPVFLGVNSRGHADPNSSARSREYSMLQVGENPSGCPIRHYGPFCEHSAQCYFSSPQKKQGINRQLLKFLSSVRPLKIKLNLFLSGKGMRTFLGGPSGHELPQASVDCKDSRPGREEKIDGRNVIISRMEPSVDCMNSTTPGVFL